MKVIFLLVSTVCFSVASNELFSRLSGQLAKELKQQDCLQYAAFCNLAMARWDAEPHKLHVWTLTDEDTDRFGSSSLDMNYFKGHELARLDQPYSSLNWTYSDFNAITILLLVNQHPLSYITFLLLNWARGGQTNLLWWC